MAFLTPKTNRVLKKLVKWVLILMGSLAAIALLFYAVVYFKTNARINKEYQVAIQPAPFIPADSVSYARGKFIATNWGCMGCHGKDLGGGVPILDEKNPVGILYPVNITSGKGGIQYTDKDWIRVLRHGLNKNLKSVWFMPAQDMYKISEQDLGDLLHYLKQQPAVDRTSPAKSLKPLGRMLVFFNKFPLLPAEMIDQTAIPPDSVAVGTTPAYGHYLATTCKGCHGDNFQGAPPHAPGEPAIPNISMSGEVKNWTAEDFIAVFRKGITPQGRQLSDVMPWKIFNYSDNELKAIFTFLQTTKK